MINVGIPVPLNIAYVALHHIFHAMHTCHAHAVSSSVVDYYASVASFSALLLRG